MRLMPKRLTAILQKLQNVLADPERKSIGRIIWEFLRYCVAKRCIAGNYFSSFLYRRRVPNYLDYVATREGLEIQDKLNDARVADLVSNKLLFVEHFSRGGLPVPRLLGYNTLDRICLKEGDTWRSAELSTPQALSRCLEELMSAAGTSELFLKQIRGSSGRGAFKVLRSQLVGPAAKVDGLYAAIVKNCYVIQEVVPQHPALAKLSATALNTMRIDTFRAAGQPAEILSAYLRVGGVGNVVDNVAAGGVFVGVHLETGRLKEIAFSGLHSGRAGGVFRSNPANGIVFDGFQVPLFEEVKNVVLQAAAWLPPALLGWDVGVSPSGPVLIEANMRYYDIAVTDVGYGGYNRHPIWRKAREHARKAPF